MSRDNDGEGPGGSCLGDGRLHTRSPKAMGCTWPFANHSTRPVPNKMNGTPQTAEERRDAAAKVMTHAIIIIIIIRGIRLI